MDGLKLLTKAQSAGLIVEAQGDRLIIKGPKTAGAIAKELLANKAAVLAALATTLVPTDCSVIEDAPENGWQAQGTSPAGQGGRVQDDRERVTHDYPPRSIADINPTDPIQDRCNVVFCAVLRLTKAMLAAVIVAGSELAAAERELGAGFPEFVATKTPWTLPAVRAVINFATQAGLRPEGISPAVAVPLARLLEATALLGELYVAEGNGQGSAAPLKKVIKSKAEAKLDLVGF
jgi:hypothetical protein